MGITVSKIYFSSLVYGTGFNIILDIIILMFVDYLKCENYVKNKGQLISKDDRFVSYN